MHSRRNKWKNRKLMSKIDKAGRRFERRDRRNVVRRRREFQDGSAEFEVFQFDGIPGNTPQNTVEKGSKVEELII